MQASSLPKHPKLVLRLARGARARLRKIWVRAADCIQLFSTRVPRFLVLDIGPLSTCTCITPDLSNEQLKMYTLT